MDVSRREVQSRSVADNREAVAPVPSAMEVASATSKLPGRWKPPQAPLAAR